MKIADGTGQAINFVGKHAIEPTLPCVAEHFLERRAVQGICRVSPIFVDPKNGVVLLALAVGFEAFALGFK
jgi:hypothetical protein